MCDIIKSVHTTFGLLELDGWVNDEEQQLSRDCEMSPHESASNVHLRRVKLNLGVEEDPSIDKRLAQLMTKEASLQSGRARDSVPV